MSDDETTDWKAEAERLTLELKRAKSQRIAELEADIAVLMVELNRTKSLISELERSV